MPLVLKLVGYSQDHKCYQIKDSFEGPVNIKLLNELFTFWGLTEEEVEKIKFITDSEQIKNAEKFFLVKSDEERIIFVFTSDSQLRAKLISIFIKEGTEVENNTLAKQQDKPEQVKSTPPPGYNFVQTPDVEICQPVTKSQNKEQDTVPVLTNELIEIMNVKSISLFGDSDFKNLIHIYLKRPELFNTFAKYVQHGNVIEESLLPPKKFDELTEEEKMYFDSLADKIINFNLDLVISKEEIIARLIKYSGHLNLTLRSILCDMAS